MDFGYTGPGVDETSVQIPLGHEFLDHSRKIQSELLVPQYQVPPVLLAYPVNPYPSMLL